MMNSRSLGITIACCGMMLLAACRGEQAGDAGEGTPPARLLDDVPLFPLSTPTTVQGTSESVEKRYASAMSADTIAEWYRRNLGNLGWGVLSDAKMPNGSITILAERGGTPLWVMIEPRQNGGTHYRIVSAEPGSD